MQAVVIGTRSSVMQSGLLEDSGLADSSWAGEKVWQLVTAAEEVAACDLLTNNRSIEFTVGRIILS